MPIPNNKFSFFNEYFDRIYVLTLRSSTERHNHIRKTFDGLDYTLFYGTDKKDLDIKKLIDHNIFDEHANRVLEKAKRKMSIGEIACSISHRGIYKDIIKNNYSKSLILEDDSEPITKNFSLFSAVVKELPKEWDFFLLGYHGAKKSTLKNKIKQNLYLLNHLFHIEGWHRYPKKFIKELCLRSYSPFFYYYAKARGGYAYAISLSGAQKGILYQTPIRLRADRIFDYHAIHTHKKNSILLVKPQFFRADSIVGRVSTI